MVDLIVAFNYFANTLRNIFGFPLLFVGHGA
jgi:hypothetical protein